MRHQTIGHAGVLAIAGILLALAPTNAARASIIVDVGWDLFETDDPTTFAGVPWEGVPLGTFDFGGAVGVKNTGTTDTIVERLDVASVPGAPPPATAGTIDIELVALQLVSVSPIDLGAGLDFHYITLDPSSPSTGQMTITFDDAGGGTFDSFIDVDFDVRIGALNGPIITQDLLQLSAADAPWDRIAPPNALKIPDVNHLLNGVDNAADFWPDPFTEAHPTGAEHSVQATPPEPAALSLLSLGSLLVITRRRA